MTPLSDSKTGVSTFGSPSAVTSVVFQAGYTGGAPGSPTFLWVMDSKGGTNAAFNNPLNASSQSISAGGAHGSGGTAFAHCVVTDSRADVANTPQISFTMSF